MLYFTCTFAIVCEYTVSYRNILDPDINFTFRESCQFKDMHKS